MLKTAPTIKPPIITIIGSAGVGKNSLGGVFPNPVFIQAEDSETVFEGWDADVMPAFMPRLAKPKLNQELQIVSIRQQVDDQFRWLATKEHDRKTVVFDTNTEYDKLLQIELLLKYNVDSIGEAAGGFQNGYNELAEWHGDLMTKAQALQRRGMAVVFLGHQGVKKIKAAPDKDEYSVFSLDMHDKCASVYINRSDAVIYIRKETFVQGKETDKKGRTTKFGKLIDSGEREAVTSGDGQTGYMHAKNRYNMPPVIPLPIGENPLLQYIRYFNKEAKE